MDGDITFGKVAIKDNTNWYPQFIFITNEPAFYVFILDDNNGGTSTKYKSGFPDNYTPGDFTMLSAASIHFDEGVYVVGQITSFTDQQLDGPGTDFTHNAAGTKVNYLVGLENVNSCVSYIDSVAGTVTNPTPNNLVTVGSTSTPTLTDISYTYTEEWLSEGSGGGDSFVATTFNEGV